MTAKKILIVAVNYNTYGSLYNFLDNTKESLESCKVPVFLQVIVADNSTKREEIDTNRYQSINLKVCKLDNVGYLGGAQYVINNFDNVSDYDFIAVSNVDLTLDKTFFSSLCNKSYPSNVGWVAPSIYSLQEGRDKKTMNRTSKWRLVALRALYRSPRLYKFYCTTLYKRKKLAFSSSKEQNIYAGHGAFILLTKQFFNIYKRLDYPIFLFCEEIYIAELVRKAGMIVRYDPSLKIWDREHVSTGIIDFKRQCKLNYDAVNYILDTFYK